MTSEVRKMRLNLEVSLEGTYRTPLHFFISFTYMLLKTSLIIVLY